MSEQETGKKYHYVTVRTRLLETPAIGNAWKSATEQNPPFAKFSDVMRCASYRQLALADVSNEDQLVHPSDTYACDVVCFDSLLPALGFLQQFEVAMLALEEERPGVWDKSNLLVINSSQPPKQGRWSPAP